MTGFIDVHHHYLSESYLAAVGIDRAAMPGSAGHVEPWTAEQSIALMDDSGIGTAMLSVSAPGIDLGGAAETAAFARACNEAQAGIVREYPDRFGMFAILPLPDIEASLHELEYAYDALATDGVVLMSNYAGDYIGTRKFWPLFDELQRRKSVVLVHPTLPHGFNGYPGVSLSTLEFPFDTARAIVSMLHDGTGARFPDVKVIWSHAGGAMPYLAGRTAVLSRRNKEFQLSGDSLFLTMGNFYYDLTQSCSIATFECLRAIAPIEHLLFGSDCPFAKEQQLRAVLAEIERLAMTQEQRRKLERGNALTLFPRLQRSGG